MNRRGEKRVGAGRKKSLSFTKITKENVLEIARIYKALKRFADLQGPICYKDAQNTEMNLTVY